MAYGWRGRFGVILPADNVVFEPEAYSLGLAGVSFHTVRLVTWDREAMPRAGVEFSSAFAELGVDGVAYACAETSFIGGNDANKAIGEGITARTALPAVTASQAMVEGLRALGVSRIALAAPYRQSSVEALAEYLLHAGIDPVSVHSRDFSATSDDPREWFATNRQPVGTARAMALAADHADAEVVFIAATNLATMSALPELERELGKPVVSSNSALIWSLLTRHGIEAPVATFGQLGRKKWQPLGTAGGSGA